MLGRAYKGRIFWVRWRIRLRCGTVQIIAPSKFKCYKHQARRLAIDAQFPSGQGKFPAGKEGIARIIEHLGYVQIDTISVIQRAHHHTLWNRRPDYEMTMLDELQSSNRRIFEYWGHAMSYLPISDYRYYLPRMKQFADPYGKWEKQRLEKFGYMMKPVLERIKKEGPLSSKDFQTTGEKKRGTWWDWRPAKVALEMLFWRGDLMITRRDNFQRVYDLTERVIPDDIDKSCPDNDELGRFFISRALKSYGAATEKEIREHIHAIDRDIVADVLNQMIESGEVLPVVITGIENSKYYILPESMEKVAKIRKTLPNVFILSPFDNFVIQRERIKTLFGFDYALECYVPAPKRKHGYFVLPILWGENFAGRMDSKSDRKKRALIIKKLFLELSSEKLDGLYLPFAEKLMEFARFNHCDHVKLDKVFPTLAKQEINRLLKSL